MLGIRDAEIPARNLDIWGGTPARKRSEFFGGGTGNRSSFNKDKYLPLAYTPFKIHSNCCHAMKKSPMKIYQRKTGLKPYLGTMTSESRLRLQAWIRTGCNAFDSHDPKSTPMAFWSNDDVLQYIKRENLEICSVYGNVECDDEHCHCTGCERTGCVFCGFGAHLKGYDRFVQLGVTHPQLYDYCMGGGEWIDNPDYIEGLSKEPDRLGWIAWNPKKLWVPSSKGLGMKYVFDCVNEIYGPGTIKY